MAKPTEGPVTRWARENATVVLPVGGRQAFEPYPYQVELFDDSASRRQVLKARQVGLSNAIAIEAAYKCLHTDNRTVLFVSRNQRLASELLYYCLHTLNGMRNPPKLVRCSMSEIEFENGSRIVSLPANPNTGRGIAASDVYLDEQAFHDYDEFIFTSVMGTVSTGGSITVISTPNGRNNKFFRLWSGIDGGPEWSRHRVHWSDCPRYDEAWARAKRAEMTRQGFAQEYDCDFVASGEAVFSPEDLARCKEGYAPPVRGPYVTAWDIGRRQDYTVGITLGVHGDTWSVAAFERFLAPYPIIQGRIEERFRKFPGIHAVESNGIGDAVIENLNLPVAPRGELLEGCINPFTTTPRSKVQAIQALQLLVQNGVFKHDHEDLDREMQLYQWEDEGLQQDCVMAAAIAAYQIVAPGEQVQRVVYQDRVSISPY